MDAVTRIQQIGMPRRNNELWTFFPVARIPNVLSADGDCLHHASLVAGSANAPRNDKQESLDFSKENDFAALLPLAKNARTMVRTIPEGANEMAMLKCNDDFGHTVLDIGKGAHVSLEILDNKVQHEIVAERFDISVGEGADVEIFFANPASALPLRFRHFRITQAANSTVRFSNILTDSGIGRISMDCDLNGEGATFDYRSLSMLDNTASMHQRLTIRHNAPNTVSTQLARNLLSGSAYASYDGMVIVGEKCTKVNSGQLVNTILLSENASVSVKPVLKIYHDDVECTHGNTVGELDAEQMFYLVSRGIPKETAKKMLMASFAKETFYPLPETPAKKRLLQTLSV